MISFAYALIQWAFKTLMKSLKPFLIALAILIGAAIVLITLSYCFAEFLVGGVL